MTKFGPLSKWIHVESVSLSVSWSAILLHSDVSEVKWMRRPDSTRFQGPNYFRWSPTQSFFPCPTFHLELSLLKLSKLISLHHWATFKISQPKKKNSFTSFFLWPCNLFPSFFPLSSMVSHTEEQRSKKEVNEFELPFERRKLSLLSLHLIRSGCCFWVSHSHRRKTLIFSLACCLIFYSRSLSSLSLTIWKNITFWMVPALLFEATLVACDSLDILFFSPSNP